MADEQPHVVYTAANSREAHLFKSLLARRGIEAIVLNDALQGAAGGVPLGTSTAPCVAVAEEDFQKSREVAIAFQRQMEIGPPQVDDIFPSEGVAEEEDWPTCSQCGRRRQTVCPICSIAGTDFPLAEYNVAISPELKAEPESCACSAPGSSCDEPPAEELPAEGAGEKLPTLLVCETCDEVFEPRYYRLCQWCGHDFGEGIEVPLTSGEPLDRRTLLVMGLLGTGALAVLAYLLFMLSR